MIDTHCHLDAPAFDHDRADVLFVAAEHGVRAILIPSVHPSTFDAVKALCLPDSACYPAYGIHPLWVPKTSDEALDLTFDTIKQRLTDDRPPVAIGEIGLDFFVKDADRSRQEAFFTRQLDYAASLNLPVVLHVRHAVDRVLFCVRKSRVRAGIAHAFNGSVEQAKAFIAMGFCLGFGGAMTYSGAHRIHRLAKALPLTSIVLETDAPDIPPAWLHGGRNSPDQLLRIADVLANIREQSLPEIIEATSQNASRILNIP